MTWRNHGATNGLWHSVTNDSGAEIEVAREESASQLVALLNSLDEKIERLNKFAAAFEVMARRGWGVVQFPSGWCIAIKDTGNSALMQTFRVMRWPDPCTALIVADKWWRENIEQETEQIS